MGRLNAFVRSPAIRRELPLLVGLLFGALLLVGVGAIDKRSDEVLGSDFSGFWAGARTVLEGRDVYDGVAFRDATLRLGTQVPDRDVFTYPPYVTAFLLPFALLPLSSAAALWTVGGLLATVVGLRALLHTYMPAMPSAHVLVGFLALGSQSAVLTFVGGQWSFWLIGAWSAVAVGLRGAGQGRAGAAAALLLVKPQLAVLGLLGVARRVSDPCRPRFLLGFVVAIVGLGAMSLYGGLKPWVEWMVSVPAARSAEPRVTTLPAALFDLIGAAGPLTSLVLLLVAVGLVWKFSDEDASFALWLAVSLTFAIYSRSYDHLQLLVPLVIGASAVMRRSRRAAFWLMFAGTLVLVAGGWVLFQVVAPARQSESFGAFVPAGILLLLMAFLWSARNSNVQRPCQAAVSRDRQRTQ